MANPRKVKKAQSSATAKLAAAIEFVMPAFIDKGEFEQYCRIGNNQIVSFNRVIGIGHPIDEDITICPHLGRLADALKNAGETLNMTELDSGRLSIKGDNLRAIIPCVPGETIPPVMPDPACAVIDDRIKDAFALTNKIIKEGDANTPWIETAVLLRANTAFSTNGKVALEYWHGIDLPPGLTIPKIAVTAILKTDKKLTRFGFSQQSVTFYFEDGSWLRTQTFTEKYPDADRAMNEAFGSRTPADLPDVPEGVFAAIEAVRSHADGAAVFLGPGIVRSHPAEGVGADYPVPALTGYTVVSSDLIKIAAIVASHIDFNAHDDKIIFFGASSRGVVMKMRG